MPCIYTCTLYDQKPENKTTKTAEPVKLNDSALATTK